MNVSSSRRRALTMTGKMIETMPSSLMTQRTTMQANWMAVKRWTRRIGTLRRNM